MKLLMWICLVVFLSVALVTAVLAVVSIASSDFEHLGVFGGVAVLCGLAAAIPFRELRRKSH